MKKLLIIPALGLALAGCNYTDIIAGVQQAAKAECGFVPAEAMIISIWEAGVGTTFQAVASAICSGVTAKGGAYHRSGSFTVNGRRIMIEGHFAR